MDDVFEEEPYPRAPLWKDLNEWEGDSGPEALEAIAQGIVERYHGTSDSTVHEYDEAMDRLPGNEDVIWRIRVKVCKLRFMRSQANGGHGTDWVGTRRSS